MNAPARNIDLGYADHESAGEFGMAEKVNLDAMIPRQDFLTEEVADGGAGGDRGKQSASATDLRKGEMFFSTLRKPDFQRETAAWSPVMVKEFIKSFVEDDLVPSVICWLSPSRLSFVIDGAHRLSAIIAWLMDDYGDGELTKAMFNGPIPDEQLKVGDKTRALVKKEIGLFKDYASESTSPGTLPALSSRVRSLANAQVPLLWVKGTDSAKAERAFMTINQSAVEIDPTEFAIINSRTKPNAIAARAIVRNGSGHKYWGTFSEAGQSEVVKEAKEIYAALYRPPLPTPPRTEELPIAGYGYGTQTLPLIFDFANIANGIQVTDVSKSKKRFDVTKQDKPDEQGTLRVLNESERLCRRISSTHASSLGLHPAVYFYSSTMKHQPTTVLAVAQFVKELEGETRLNEFSSARRNFEEFLVSHKMFMNQLTMKHGSMAKGFLPIKNYYKFVLDRVLSGDNEAAIENALQGDPKYQTLVKERPILTSQAKKFSSDAKLSKLMTDVLSATFRCDICGARVDKKAMHLGHTKDRKDGGIAVTQNSGWEHPYCNTTYKPFLQKKEPLDDKTR